MKEDDNFVWCKFGQGIPNNISKETTMEDGLEKVPKKIFYPESNCVCAAFE